MKVRRRAIPAKVPHPNACTAEITKNKKSTTEARRLLKTIGEPLWASCPEGERCKPHFPVLSPIARPRNQAKSMVDAERGSSPISKLPRFYTNVHDNTGS
jgi:hypothetical protein